MKTSSVRFKVAAGSEKKFWDIHPPGRACRSVTHSVSYWQFFWNVKLKRLCVLKHGTVLGFFLASNHRAPRGAYSCSQVWTLETLLSFLAIPLSFSVLIFFFFFFGLLSWISFLTNPSCHQHKRNLFHAFCLAVYKPLLHFFRSRQNYSETSSASWLKISDVL